MEFLDGRIAFGGEAGLSSFLRVTGFRPFPRMKREAVSQALRKKLPATLALRQVRFRNRNTLQLQSSLSVKLEIVFLNMNLYMMHEMLTEGALEPRTHPYFCWNNRSEALLSRFMRLSAIR